MSSEQIANGINPLDSNLGGAWDILKGYSGRDTDLGIARRFGGAAAAYSLRDIGAMNGRIVKVRRDSGETTDPEEDFSANQVSSGALEDWVNGKLESTLPADVDTAAAAYSLRKVKASYAEDAVRIRRTSDSVEVNVAFDSDDKVSASSAITNTTEEGGESGETTANTVAEFLSEERTTFITNPIFSTTTSGASVTSQTTTDTSSTFEFTATSDAFIRDARKTTNIGADLGDTVSFDVTATGVSQTFGVRIRKVGANNNILQQDGLDNGKTTISFTVSSNEPAGYFNFTGLVSDGGSITVDNLKVVGKSATVHTWYDQAGSNDAVQATASSQPKIAENGSLLADGIDFDGSNDLLALTSALGATTTQSIFVVQKNDVTTGGTLLFDNRDANDDGSAIFATDTAGNKQASWDAADAEHTATNNEELISLIKTTSAIKIIANAVEKGSTASTSTIDISNAPKIGASFSSGNHYDGSIKELICYNSDQSNNRFKIESNINNYYGLYDDENETNGIFVSSNLNSSFTANGKLGFTATSVSSNDGGGAIELNNTVASGDILYVSFNSTKDSSTGDGVAIRQTSGGTIASNEQPFKSGFNAFTLTANAANADFVVFMDDSGSEFTISDFRVSRIARNGFVETWYDQSNNGNNAVQGTANKQPKIVSNGGTHKLEGLPAINFNDATSHCLTSSNYSRSGSDLPLSMMAVFDKSTTDTDYLFAANKSDDDAFQRLVLRSTTFEYGERDDANTQKVGNGGSPSLDTTFLMSAFTGGTTSSVFINGSSILSDVDTDVGTQTFDQIDIGANNGDGASSNNPFSGNISELYLFETNLSTDRATIEGEIANHYNITLS